MNGRGTSYETEVRGVAMIYDTGPKAISNKNPRKRHVSNASKHIDGARLIAAMPARSSMLTFSSIAR